MAEFFYEYGLFFMKALTFVIAAVAIIMAIVVAAMKGRHAAGAASEGHIEIKKYNERLENMEEALSFSLMEPELRKQAEKEKKATEKKEKKAAKQAARKARKQRGSGETIIEEKVRPRLYVLDFDGDIRASQVGNLRREITAVLTAATPEDEVMVRLESGGGMVTSYGLAASQLDRLRDRKIPLTICVDKVAASGGYMMACVADRLVAAPFAVLGSIGVVAQIPNFHRLLKEHNIDFEMLTAGKYKRTLTLFGENTDEGRQKFIEDIERIHAQFKQYVSERRPGLDIEQVATGEIWSGQDTLDLKLADRLSTSDQYMVEACDERDVLLVSYKAKKNLMEKLTAGVESAVDNVLFKWFDRLMKSRFSIG